MSSKIIATGIQKKMFEDILNSIDDEAEKKIQLFKADLKKKIVAVGPLAAEKFGVHHADSKHFMGGGKDITHRINITYGAKRKDGSRGTKYIYVNMNINNPKMNMEEASSVKGQPTQIIIRPRTKKALFVPTVYGLEKKMFAFKKSTGKRTYEEGAVKGKHFEYKKNEIRMTRPVVSQAIEEIFGEDSDFTFIDTSEGKYW